MFEVVSGVGMAKDLVDRHGTGLNWLRLPLGPDCGEAALAKIATLKNNYEVFEPIWRSTDMDDSQVEAARAAAAGHNVK